MQFYMPVRVYDEQDCVRRHAAELGALGSKALIVTGRHSAAACGALGDVEDALREAGKAFCVFSEIEENPSVETVMRAALYGKEEGADFCIGIGGGSPMDAAKAIAFLLAQEQPDVSTLYDAKVPTKAVPIAEVPTTCGTGSEVTGVSVLTRHEKRTKGSIPHKIFGNIALIDGKYLKGVPRSVITNTAVDALAHMVESYESVKSDVYSRAAILAGLRLWSTVRDVIAGEREADDADRAALMRASAFAGIAIAQTGTSIPHALSYIVTYDVRMPHGKACGIFLPGFFREMSSEDRDVLLGAAGFEDQAAFDAYISKLYPEILVPEETMRRTCETVLGQTERLKACRFPVDAEVLARIADLRG